MCKEASPDVMNGTGPVGPQSSCGVSWLVEQKVGPSDQSIEQVNCSEVITRFITNPGQQYHGSDHARLQMQEMN